MTGTRFNIEVRPKLPPRLDRLQDLADDLLYSWDRSIRRLFVRLDQELWRACGHNPRLFLRRVSQQTLEDAEHDRGFLEEYHRALSTYDSYRREPIRSSLVDKFDAQKDLIGYFCLEFGLHESLPVYSGGLGILAGDHCKTASDLGLPFVAVGLLYRQGYFSQTIDAHGNQIVHYKSNRFEDLPLTEATDAGGKLVEVRVPFPGREVRLKVWRAKIGHISLYLLDSDLPANSDKDRSITHQLYGGDRDTRIQQEMLLGIGGVRALRAMALAPTVWHVNEGHAAFLILERCSEQVANGLDFDSALELVAAGTVFTTHTPVVAGHDVFSQQLIGHYFQDYCKESGLPAESIQSLGQSPHDHHSFNMTALGLRGSRHHNGVSRIHGQIASNMASYVWPQIPAEENPITHITNGVHVPTFLSREWINLLDNRFSEWRTDLCQAEFWNCIDEIPDHRFWSLREELKAILLRVIAHKVTGQGRRNGLSEARLKKITRLVAKSETDVLVLGFARRFATYKRANMLLSDAERLARIMGDPKRPVLLIIAGKAHPHDAPGQDIIRTVHHLSQRPEFLGKILLVEDYDMALARVLVAGVDVWLNTPIFPMEASGTSGQKAAINGAINLSVLDGWWGEAWDGENGWGIAPHDESFDAQTRDREEVDDLYEILEKQVLPLYFERGSLSYPKNWVAMAKASVKSMLPRFNTERMLIDYVNQLYAPAQNQAEMLGRDHGRPARELARWKKRIHQHWSGVSLHSLSGAATDTRFLAAGDTLPIHLAVHLNGLAPDDVVVECLLGMEQEGRFAVEERIALLPTGVTLPDGALEYGLDLQPRDTGLQSYQVRIYPFHRLLSHRFEVGYMLWLN